MIGSITLDTIGAVVVDGLCAGRCSSLCTAITWGSDTLLATSRVYVAIS